MYQSVPNFLRYVFAKYCFIALQLGSHRENKKGELFIETQTPLSVEYICHSHTK